VGNQDVDRSVRRPARGAVQFRCGVPGDDAAAGHEDAGRAGPQLEVGFDCGGA
jgi:hypothetical protein